MDQSQELIDKINAELIALDRDLVEIDGQRIKPSQCYRFEVKPTHILFNTNCPDSLKQKVQAILSKYYPIDESRAQ
ncbi:MAG TPA: hypothetical protein VK644_14160 [Chitinophagaceae bacterium]|nr:hypothetical protein [Chitinophagaceae bacterium]